MTAVSFNSLPRHLALDLLANQKLMSPGQRDMCIHAPGLVWVRPRSRYLSKYVRMNVFYRDLGLCAYCGAQLSERTFTVDHVFPVAHGGTDDFDNLTVACRPCNSRKGARLIDG